MTKHNQFAMKKRTAILALALTVTAVAGAQENYGSSPEQQRACMEALSVYRSFRDQENFKEAYNAWKTTCKECPENVNERLYSDGVRFIKEEYKVAQKNQNKARLTSLTDSLFWAYDMRIKHFPSTDKNPQNGCEIKAYKASDMLVFKPNDLDEALKIFKEVIECMGDKTSPIALSGYYVTLHKLIDKSVDARKKELRDQIISDYLVINDYIDNGIMRTEGKTKEGYEKAKNNIDEIFVLFARCEDMLPVLKEKVGSDPNNMELKKKALGLMNKKECVDDPVYLKWAQEIHDLDPSHPSAYSIAMGMAKNSDWTQALKYLEQAVDLCKDCPDRANYLLKAGQVASAAKNNAKARSYANQLIQMGKNVGEAYILLGDLAAGSSGNCNDVFGGKSVFWVAVDYYEMARAKDASVSEKAGKKISQYKAYWPTKQDTFGNNLKEGEKYMVECLGVETTVRTIK